SQYHEAIEFSLRSILLLLIPQIGRSGMATFSPHLTKVPRRRWFAPLGALISLGSPALADCPTGWRAAGAPAPRYNHAVAYDGQRNVLVLFGGSNSQSEAPGIPLGDTWEFDGSAWHHRDATGPSPRRSHAMAYDSLRHVVVLVGGIAANNE